VVETEREEIQMRLPRRRLLLVALPLALVAGGLVGHFFFATD
jgi:hypothetical protein